MTADAARPVVDIDERWVRGTSWAIAATAVFTISTVVAALDARLWHWFMLPVAACGVLVGVDAVEWARRRLDIFDPQALVGLFGCHFFYAAPMLHVVLNYWPAYINPLADWRGGLGAMASINVAGLLIYRSVLAVKHKPHAERSSGPVDEKRFIRFGILAIAVGIAGFAVEVATLGGPSGYLASASGNREVFTGTGWLLLVGESFPLMAFVVYLVRRRAVLVDRPKLLGWAFMAFAIAQFLVGGLRGSRSNTIWPVLIGLIIVHLTVRPVRRRRLAALALVFVAFMYCYGVYKSAGSEILRLGDDRSGVSKLSSETGRTMPAMLLGDLGRSDIQAMVLQRQLHDVAPLSYGATYLGAVGFVVPDAVQPSWLITKVTAGTDMLYGEGTSEAGDRSSRIYGLAGEGILNFGVFGGIAVFAVFGSFIRAAKRLYRAAPGRHFGSQLFAAMACVCGILGLGSDLDNMAWFLVKTGLPLAAVIFMARRSTNGVKPGQYLGAAPLCPSR